MRTIHHSSGSQNRISSSPIGGDSPAIAAANVPRTVIGATASATAMLATTPTRLTVPAIMATSGAVTICAARAIASRSVTPRGTPTADIRSRRVGASRIRAAVAQTDRANPGSTASAGQTPSATITAAHSAGIAAERRPATRASSPTAPITAARTTLGDGRTSTTKHASTMAARTAEVRRPTPAACSTSRTAPQTIAKFAPLTVGQGLYRPLHASDHLLPSLVGSEAEA